MTDAAPDTTHMPLAGTPAVEKLLERATAVNGTPPEDEEHADESGPVEGGDEMPSPTEGSARG